MSKRVLAGTLALVIIILACPIYSQAQYVEITPFYMPIAAAEEGELHSLDENDAIVSENFTAPELLEVEYPSIPTDDVDSDELLLTDIIEDKAVSSNSNSIVTGGMQRGPLSLASVVITHIWVGNTKTSDSYNYILGDTSTDWVLVWSGNATSLTGTLNPDGYSYIRFRIVRMGYCNFYDETLNNVSYERSVRIDYLDQYGNSCPVGGAAYGFKDDFIFGIPYGVSSVNARFHYIDTAVPRVELEANAYLTMLYPAPAPTTPAVNYNTVANKAVVTGINTSMEYQSIYTGGWVSVSGTSMELPLPAANYTLFIRYKAVSGGLPSLACSLTIKTPSDGPLGYFGYADIDEFIRIYSSTRQIEVAFGDGASFVPVTAGDYSLVSFINAIPTGSFNRVYIRYAASSSEPASDIYYYTLYARNPNTPDNVIYANGALYNLTPDMCFRFDGGDWYVTSFSAVNITSFMSTTSETLLEIRYMPTSTTSCSAIRTIVLPPL